MRNECTEKKIVGIFWGFINLLMICSYLIVGFPLYCNHCIFFFSVRKKVDLFFFLSFVWVKVHVQEHSKVWNHKKPLVSETIATSISSWCSVSRNKQDSSASVWYNSDFTAGPGSPAGHLAALYHCIWTTFNVFFFLLHLSFQSKSIKPSEEAWLISKQ